MTQISYEWCRLHHQEARKAQLENHEPEDEEEDLDKDMQDSGKVSFFF